MIFKHLGKEYVVLFCQKVEQPIGNLYNTTIPWRILLDISFSQPRVLMGLDEEGKEEYVGIQRLLSVDRQKEIKEYIQKDPYATFPSSIIINFPHEKVSISQVNSEGVPLSNIEASDNLDGNIITEIARSIRMNSTYLIIFPYEIDIAQVIDGQHRLSGFVGVENEMKFDLPVTIFIDQLVETQAEIFSIINGKQTRVTPSLVYDLFGLSSKRSPYKVANEIVKLLNESELSPVKNWIKILGKSNQYYLGYVTQSTIVKNLIPLYTGNIKQAEEDKRLLALGKKLSEEPTLSKRKAVFRKYFIAEKDEVIFKAIVNFFSAISIVFNNEWEKRDSIFKKTVGFTALFKVFNYLSEIGLQENNFSESFYKDKLYPCREVIFNDIQLSSRGVNQLYERFKEFLP